MSKNHKWFQLYGVTNNYFQTNLDVSDELVRVIRYIFVFNLMKMGTTFQYPTLYHQMRCVRTDLLILINFRSNQRFGVGKATPESMLDIVGTVNATGRLLVMWLFNLDIKVKIYGPKTGNLIISGGQNNRHMHI